MWCIASGSTPPGSSSPVGEDVASPARACSSSSSRRLVRPDRRAVVAVEDLPRAAGVPEDGEQDRGRAVLARRRCRARPRTSTRRPRARAGRTARTRRPRRARTRRRPAAQPWPSLKSSGPQSGCGAVHHQRCGAICSISTGTTYRCRDGAARAAGAVRLRADDGALPRLRARPREPLGRRRAAPRRRRARAADRAGAGRGGRRAARRRDAAGRAARCSGRRSTSTPSTPGRRTTRCCAS